MELSVIIPTIRPAHLDAAIASICNQQWQKWELIVVAQGNDPELKAFVAKGHPDPRVRFVHLTQKGSSRARNAGVAQARHPLILFTDDDCEAQADWLTVVAQCFSDYPDVGLVGGALVPPKPVRRGITSCPTIAPSEAIYDPVATPHKPPQGWYWASGNLAVRRSVCEQIGDFDVQLGPGTRFSVAEDSDYGFRVERAGIKMLSTPRSVVHHTYGMRYGLRATLKSSESYARGNGAMAGKLTLLGDARGAEWLKQTQHECTTGAIHPARLHRLPFTLNRLRHFQAAYEECVTRFRVDERGLLQPCQGAAADDSS